MSQGYLVDIKNQHDLLLFIQKNGAVCNFDPGMNRDIEKIAHDGERHGLISISGHKDGDEYWTLTKKGHQHLIGNTHYNSSYFDNIYGKIKKYLRFIFS